MADFITILTNFISSLTHVEIFTYLLASFALFGVIQLIRKAVYE